MWRMRLFLVEGLFFVRGGGGSGGRLLGFDVAGGFGEGETLVECSESGDEGDGHADAPY